MIVWKDEADRMNAVFEEHGLPTIPKGAKGWLPTLAQNVEELSKKIKEATCQTQQ